MMRRDAFRTMAAAALPLALAGALLVSACTKQAPAPAASPAPKASPAATAAAAPKPAQFPRSLIFSSPPIGTATYVVVTGLSAVIEKYTGAKVIVQPMASMSLQVNEMEARRVDIAILSTAADYSIFRGEQEYKELGPKAIRPLGGGHGNSYVWVTRPDTGIKSVPDMAGKRVAYISGVSPPLTATYRLVLEYHGIADKIVALNRASMDAAARMLIEKRADVIGGPYGAFAYEVEQATGMVVIPITKADVDYVNQKRPDLVTSIARYPAGYFGLKQEIATATAVQGMVVFRTMPDTVAYGIMKAVLDHPEETKAIHRDVGDYNLERGLQFGFTAPIHPGAVKYYQEKGVWKKEHEDLQQKLLALETEIAARKK